MTTRSAVHALVDELGEEELELAKVALQEIRAEAAEIESEEREELMRRQAECTEGELLDARAFLAALRQGSDSSR